MHTHGQIDVTGSVQITANDEADLIRVNTGIGDGEVIMPSAATVLGRRYTIRRVAGGGSISILPTEETDTFDGNYDYTIGTTGSRRVTFQAVQIGSHYGYETFL
jgi:hypothetical protein